MLSEVDIMFKDILRDLISDHETNSNICIKKLARYAQIEVHSIRTWIDLSSLEAPTKEQVVAIHKAISSQMKESIIEEQMQNFEELEIQVDLITQVLESEKKMKQGWFLSVGRTINRIVEDCRKNLDA